MVFLQRHFRSKFESAHCGPWLLPFPEYGLIENLGEFYPTLFYGPQRSCAGS